MNGGGIRFLEVAGVLRRIFEIGRDPGGLSGYFRFLEVAGVLSEDF